MPLIPEKLTKYPFISWAFILLSIGFLAYVFGPENVWSLITSQVDKASG